VSLEDDLIHYARSMARVNGEWYVKKCLSLWRVAYGEQTTRIVEKALGAKPAPMSPAQHEDKDG